MEKGLLSLISTEYASLGSIEKSEKAKGYSINSRNYVIRFKNGKKVICKYLKYADKEKLGVLLSIIKFCEKNGAKVPSIVSSDSGNMFEEYGGGILYLLSFKEGEYFDGSVPEIKDFAREVAVLHKCLKTCNIHYAAEVPWEKYRHLSPSELDSIISEIKGKAGKHEFDEYILDKADFLLAQYTNNKMERGKIIRDKISLQYIHRDLIPLNVLFKDGKTEVILDLNSLAEGELVRDVAFACYRFAIHETKDTEEMKKRKEVFIKSYLEENNLDAEEIKNLKYYFINECLNRISYILRSHYFGGDDRWSFDLKKHINNIEMAEAF